MNIQSIIVLGIVIVLAGCALYYYIKHNCHSHGCGSCTCDCALSSVCSKHKK